MLPEESLIYLGDGKNCPYGGRPREDIERFAEEAVSYLVGRGVKMVVVGCNTATTAAIDHLRAKWPNLPIVGLEPAVKPACLNSVTRRIAVLATKHSLQSDMFLRTAARYADDVEVLKVVGEEFVEIVEAGEEHTVRADVAVRRVVEPLLDRDVDYIVLGCTHYPFLRPNIERVIGDRDIKVIDSGEAVARRVEWLLERYDIRAERGHKATYDFATFADDDYLKRLRQRGEQILSEYKP
jgi:glutamate racemase